MSVVRRTVYYAIIATLAIWMVQVAAEEYGEVGVGTVSGNLIVAVPPVSCSMATISLEGVVEVDWACVEKTAPKKYKHTTEIWPNMAYVLLAVRDRKDGRAPCVTPFAAGFKLFFGVRTTREQECR